MPFDPTNPVIRLCIEGIEQETQCPNQAKLLFLQAWNLAVTNLEKSTAAHYLARHQDSLAKKLVWDLVALQLALAIQDGSMVSSYPSLYLNVGKGYEGAGDWPQAMNYYRLALSHAHHLTDEGYGKMIKQGIENGLKRIGSIYYSC